MTPSEIQQRVTIGDRTFMAKADSYQLAKLDERLKAFITDGYIDTTKKPYDIDYDELLQVEMDVLGHGNSDDDDILSAQAATDYLVADRLVELIEP